MVYVIYMYNVPLYMFNQQYIYNSRMLLIGTRNIRN